QAKGIRQENDADTERDQSAGEKQGPERPVGLAGGRLGGGDVEAGNDSKRGARLLGHAAASKSEVVRRRGEQIGSRVFGQAAMADVLLNDVADPAEGVAHFTVPCSRYAKRPRHLRGTSAVSVIGS